MLDPSQQHQHHDRGSDREQTTDARQAAEALFAPKPHSFEPLDREIAPSAGDPVRRPRVLAITPTVAGHPQEPDVPIRPKTPAKPKIPKSQFARIRAWLQYGMTAEQVAQVYEISVGEVERILRIAQ